VAGPHAGAGAAWGGRAVQQQREGLSHSKRAGASAPAAEVSMMNEAEVLTWAQAIGLTYTAIPSPMGAGFWTPELHLADRTLVHGGGFGAGIPQDDPHVLAVVLRELASTRRAVHLTLAEYVAEDPEEPGRDRDWWFAQGQFLKDRAFLGPYYEALALIPPLY
jgi:hypothetical protein